MKFPFCSPELPVVAGRRDRKRSWARGARLPFPLPTVASKCLLHADQAAVWPREARPATHAPRPSPGRRACFTVHGGVFCSALSNNILPLKPEKHFAVVLSEKHTQSVLPRSPRAFLGKDAKASRAASLRVTKCLDRRRPGVGGWAWERRARPFGRNQRLFAGFCGLHHPSSSSHRRTFGSLSASPRSHPKPPGPGR